MTISILFILTAISVFLTVSFETIVFLLQLKGQKFSRWFGPQAFKTHMVMTGSLWAVSFGLIVLLQFEKHPLFHRSSVLKYAGLLVCVVGLLIAIWGFKLLGVKRSFGLNFFEDNVPSVNTSLYKFIRNPEDYGFWMAVAGFAFFTRSSYNLVIALEFIVLMIPHMHVENIPMKKSPSIHKDKDI